MGSYKFEISMSFNDVIEIEADSYVDAENQAREEADAYYPVYPAGFAGSWDYVDVVCIDEPDEDED